MNRDQAEIYSEKDKWGAEINNEHLRSEAILIEIGIDSGIFFTCVLSRLYEKLRKPQICHQDIYVDEIEKDLLNKLNDTRDRHWYHRVGSQEWKVIETVPYVLDEYREAKVDSQRITNS